VLGSVQDLEARLPRFSAWVALGVLLGSAPVLLDYATGWCSHRVVTAALLAPLLLAAVARDREARGLTVVGAAFLAHCAAVIVLATRDPEGTAVLCTDGPDYWQRSRDWIATGVSREYDLGWWLPAHVQLLAAVVLFAYTSLGLVPLVQGLYEVDLMNFYVARLLAQAESPGVGLALAWHPWSICRGVGYLLLTYEVTSLSLARLTGVSLSPWPRRRQRWLLGLGFLAADAVVKYLCLEPVRRILAVHLAEA
jgi:hypothetical protein